jgi:hypothetical protein
MSSFTQNTVNVGTINASIPSEVSPNMPNGCETGAVALAKAYLARYGNTLHKFTKRGELSRHYCDTFASWNEDLEPRHFKQVLYALVTECKTVRVVGGGRFLKWAWSTQQRRPRPKFPNGPPPRRYANVDQTDAPKEEHVRRPRRGGYGHRNRYHRDQRQSPKAQVRDFIDAKFQETLDGKQAEIDNLRRQLAENSLADAKAKHFADQCLRDAIQLGQTHQALGANATSDEQEAMRILLQQQQFARSLMQDDDVEDGEIVEANGKASMHEDRHPDASKPKSTVDYGRRRIKVIASNKSD